MINKNLIKVIFLNLAIIVFLTQMSFACPELIDQSRSQRKCFGENARLFVIVRGENLSFQWFKDGLELSNANTPVLDIANLRFENSGIYTCIIHSDSCQDLVSQTVLLYINGPSSISEQPKNAVLNFGETAVFSFDAQLNEASDKTLQIQWFKGSQKLTDDNSKVNGSNSDFLTISKVNKSDGDSAYFAVITGAACTDTLVSDKAFIIFNADSIKFQKQPEDTEVCSGIDSVNLKAEITGSNDLKFQWYKNSSKLYDGLKYKGSQSKELTVYYPLLNDSGSYKLEITSKSTNLLAYSNTAVLFVDTIPYFSSVLPDTINAIKQFKINVSPNGSHSFKYQWYKNGSPVLGETDSIYIDKVATIDDNGSYFCVVSNDCGADTTNSTYVNVTLFIMLSDLTDGQEAFGLADPYPNPAKTYTYISFTLPEDSNISLKLVNSLGINVATIFSGFLDKGKHHINFDVTNSELASDFYFLVLSTETNYTVKSIIINK